MKTAQQIVDMWNTRRVDAGGMAERMRSIAQHYNGEVAVPLPEIDKREAPAVANFFAQGIDQHGMRIASVMPNITYPPVKTDVQKSITQARDRRRAAYGWWQTNQMNLKLRRRARWLIAYSTSPILIRPDLGLKQPIWEMRSPLDTFPAETAVPDTMTPPDVIFSYRKTGGWLRRCYPGVHMAVNDSRREPEKLRDSDLINVVEYVDDIQRTLVVTGEGPAAGQSEAEYGIGDAQIINLTAGGQQGWAATLETTENLAGVCPVILPGRITLAGPKGQFDDSLGLYQQMARLMALEVNAVAKAVYPDTWFIKNQLTGGKIVTVADGLRGVVGEIEGGELKDFPLNPGFQTYPTIDRLERGMRMNSALPAELGGESASNIRTDRRGQSILSSAIDFHIQEHQDILGMSLQHELEVAAAVDKAYFGPVKKSFYVKWPGAQGRLDYTPEVIWKEDRTVIVDYAVPGMDATSLMVFIGQEIGTGLISKQTGRKQMPNVIDAEHEEGQITAEALTAALLASLQQQAQAGAITPPDLAAIQKELETGDISLADAVVKVHEAAQARQASSGEPGTPEAPVAPGSPEAQPGLAQPGQGQEQPVEAIGAPPGSLDNLRNTLSDLMKGRTLARSA